MFNNYPHLNIRCISLYLTKIIIYKINSIYLLRFMSFFMAEIKIVCYFFKWMKMRCTLATSLYGRNSKSIMLHLIKLTLWHKKQVLVIFFTCVCFFHATCLTVKQHQNNCFKHYFSLYTVQTWKHTLLASVMGNFCKPSGETKWKNITWGQHFTWLMPITREVNLNLKCWHLTQQPK